MNLAKLSPGRETSPAIFDLDFAFVLSVAGYTCAIFWDPIYLFGGPDFSRGIGLGKTDKYFGSPAQCVLGKIVREIGECMRAEWENGKDG